MSLSSLCVFKTLPQRNREEEGRSGRVPQLAEKKPIQGAQEGKKIMERSN